LHSKIPILGILGMLILVVAVSGCTSSTQYKTINTSQGSFQIPTDWIMYSKGSCIEIDSSDNSSQIQFFKLKGATDYFANMADTEQAGAENQGVYHNNVSDTSYTVYHTVSNNNNPDETDYFFMKNGNYYYMRGYSSPLDQMDQIVQTVK
jgi:hypothetical protein